MGTACSTLDYIFFITGVFTQTIDPDDQKPSHGLGKTEIQIWKIIVVVYGVRHRACVIDVLWL